jgi:hypothetical protein
MNRLIIATLTATALLALSACNKESDKGLSSETEIGLRAMSSATKSAINGTVFPNGYDMLVSAYFNIGSFAAGDTPKNYFEGIHFAKNGTAWKSTTQPKYYPIDGTLDFLAIASAGLNTPGNGIVPTATWGASSNVAKQVVVTVPDNHAKFDDLLYGAANAQGISTSGTGIAFQHAMTSVVFVAKCNVVYNAVTNVGITLTGITIDGAKYSGTLTVENPAAGGESGDLTAAWSDLGSPVANLAARVWDSGNTGIKTDESAFSSLDLTNTATAIDASHPFGDAYVLLPAQAAVPFTIYYTQHNGFEADGETPLNVNHQYQVTPTGTWAMGKKNIYSLNFTLTEIQVTPEVTNWDNKPIEQLLPDPTNGHAFVDLGLRQGGNKVLFATVNLGANSETEFGDYYQWGDIAKQYDSITGTTINSTSGFRFDYDHYLWCNGDYSSMTKYYSGDSKTTLDEADDAAHVLWGGGWRIPTETEINALLGLESFEFVENYNGSGVNGWVVCGTGAYQEASIFLPDAGEAWMQTVDPNQTRYWTKTRDNLPYRASVLYSSSSHGNLITSPMMRSSGAPIRPVLVIPE